MNIKIIEQKNDYITIKIPTNSKNRIFLKTEEEIAKKVNEVGRILTKDALEKLENKEKEINRNEEKVVLKKVEKKIIKPHTEQ